MNVAVFRRKLTYIILIVALLVPLFFLGQPKTSQSGGGTLAKIRSRYGLGQADLGQIDPASESMKLATLGLRGVASTLLWQKADYYKREQYWDRYSATLNQIALLQPHFVNVWDHQAHNLTYNIAIEFDGFRQRYEWVKKGIDYLIRGTKYNERQPILEWTLGIYTGQKIGTADEKLQYRKLFREDKDYHQSLIAQGLDVAQPEAKGFDGNPDHWLAGRLWFNKAYDLVEAGCYCKKSPHIFYSDSPKCQLRYSEAIESEGILDDRAKFSWKRGSDWWREYGNRDVMTTWGHTVKLNGLDAANQNVADLRKKFEVIIKPIQDDMIKKITDGFTDEEKTALATPADERTDEQLGLVYFAQQKLQINPLSLAEQAPRDQRFKAIELGKQIIEAGEFVKHVDSYRNQVNYAYWDIRAIAEQNDETIKSRSSLYEADQSLQKADVERALAKYNESFEGWNKVFRRFPMLMIDDIADDLQKAIRRYKRALDSDLPENFPLADFISFKEKYDANGLDMELERKLRVQSEESEATGAEHDTRKIRLDQEEKMKKEAELSAKASLTLPIDKSNARVEQPEEGSPPVPPQKSDNGQASPNINAPSPTDNPDSSPATPKPPQLENPEAVTGQG